MFRRNPYGLSVIEITTAWIEAKYHELWACKRGNHYMKMSGCVYCGSTAGRKVGWR